MIAVESQGVPYSWAPDTGPLTLPDRQAALEALFAKPAVDLVATHDEAEGVIRRARVTLQPGSPAHARAVLLGLPDARLVLDDEA